jgi:hypothetical protein
MEQYNPLKDYLEQQEIFLNEDQLEEVLGYADKINSWKANVGYRAKRVEDNEREKAFQEQWLKENEPLPWINNGNGMLQDLFIEPGIGVFDRKVITVINDRDRMMVATIIQWLGSTCGMSFLHQSLKRFNAHIVFNNSNNQ